MYNTYNTYNPHNKIPINNQTEPLLSYSQYKQVGHDYDPYKYPANLEQAQNHGRAKRVYTKKLIDEAEFQNRKVCPCCDLDVEGERISLCAGKSQIYHLGSGYALYFELMKYTIGLLLLIFTIGGIYNAATNFAGGDCHDTSGIDYCSTNFISVSGIANKRDHPQQLKVQIYINLLVVIVILLFIQLIRYKLRQIEIEADEKTVTPADYTVKVNGLPLDISDAEIINWIKEYESNEQTLEIVKVTRGYDLVEFARLTSEIETQVEAKIKECDTMTLNNIELEISEAYDKLVELRNSGMKYTKIAYVTFQKAEQANYIINVFKSNLATQKKKLKRGRSLFVSTVPMIEGRRNKLKIARAPEPSDILWQNLGFPGGEKRRRRMKTNIVTGLMVVIGFLLIVGISIAQKKIIHDSQDENLIIIQVLAIIGSFLSCFINYYMGTFVVKLVNYEKRSTQTSYFIGKTGKLSAAQIINTAFTTLVAKTIATLLFAEFNLEKVAVSDFAYYGDGGLIQAMFYIFVINAFSSPIYNIIDPIFRIKQLTRRKALNNSEHNDLSQKAAQSLFEGTQYDMSYKYSLLIKTVLATCLFAPALPLAPLLGASTLFIVYWIDKYLLLRRAALPIAVGNELSRTMVDRLQWAALMYATGNLFAYYTLENSNLDLAFGSAPMILVWISVVVSFANMILPMRYINKKLFRISDEVITNETYNEAKVVFLSDYDIENPVTRQSALNKLRLSANQPQTQTARPSYYYQMHPQNHAGNSSAFNRIFDNVVDQSSEPGRINFGPLNNYLQRFSNNNNNNYNNYNNNQVLANNNAIRGGVQNSLYPYIGAQPNTYTLN